MSEHPEIMKNVSINNPRILELINGYKDEVFRLRDEYQMDEIFTPHGVSIRDNVDYYFTDEYRNKIVDMGMAHDGYPEVLHAFLLRPENFRDKPKHPDQPSVYSSHEIRQFQEDYTKTYFKFNESMIQELGLRRNALAAAYPPGGFIGWHNNANASSYNLIFTYSETGDGFWQHINPYTQQVETVPDVAGWQCKAFYFGAYQENNKKTLVYHTARTNSCWRMTVSYIFDRHNEDWWLDAIDEIQGD